MTETQSAILAVMPFTETGVVSILSYDAINFDSEIGRGAASVQPQMTFGLRSLKKG